MPQNSSTAHDSDATPSAPSECTDCGASSFIPRTLPTGNNTEFNKEYVFAYHECDECGARFNDRSKQLQNPENLEVPSWRDVFGHPEPYQHQEEGIQRAIQTGLSNGFSVIEGACGTGKTMIALTTGLRLVKDPRTKYERIMILTSVKQQLRQFESDLKIINSNLPDDITPGRAITLVGKTDLCPYAREEVAGITQSNVAGECRRLRSQTSQLLSDGLDGVTLANEATPLNDREKWESAGSESPYIDTLPQKSAEFCPFYANYKGHDAPLFDFSHADDYILTPDETVKQAVDKGVCPHSAMSVLGRDADVIIANYYHAFDRNTLQITRPLIDDETFLICDEAHMLEPRVRGILSEKVPLFMIRRAAKEVAAVYNKIGSPMIDISNAPSPPPTSTIQEAIQESDVQLEALKPIYKTLMGVYNKLDSIVVDHLNDEHPNWDSNPEVLDDLIEIPLRDPSKMRPDKLTEWFEQQSVSEDIWEYLPMVASVIDEIYTENGTDGSATTFIEDVTELLKKWFSVGHTNYFREITLMRDDDPHAFASGWEKLFNSSVAVHNVMPRSVIGNRVDQFGGGILMSATLEPIDVYREVTGLDFISYMNNRLITTSVYNSDFPAENRLSIRLNLPKYTNDNRGDIDEDTVTRRKYATAIQQVARTTPGNVLVCMPSYREAEWAAALLKQTNNVSKDVLIDRSSSESKTQELKQDFFSGDAKVLVTSLRGTLTEGVDFDGDKLLGCIVCGVPIENIGSPKTQAVETAYTDEFGQAGFDYALTVPAVRKTRQALGRVIRGTSDVGVRVLVDGRYVGGQGTVKHYLSENEREEYDVVDDLDVFQSKLREFWS